MNFREYLKAAKEAGIVYVTKLVVADEVNAGLELNSEEAFEKVCEVVHRAYLKSSSDTPTWAIVGAVKNLLEEGKTVDEIVGLSTYTLLDRASSLL